MPTRPELELTTTFLHDDQEETVVWSLLAFRLALAGFSLGRSLTTESHHRVRKVHGIREHEHSLRGGVRQTARAYSTEDYRHNYMCKKKKYTHKDS